MDGYIHDYNRGYMIDRYLHCIIEQMSDEEKNKFIYQHMYADLNTYDNIQLTDIISKNNIDIILGEIK